MTDSTRRSLRTAFQVLVAALTTIPVIAGILATALPADSPLAAQVAAYVATLVAGSAAVAKVLNALEDAGILPAWLKGDANVPTPEPTPAEVIDAHTESPSPSPDVPDASEPDFSA